MKNTIINTEKKILKIFIILSGVFLACTFYKFCKTDIKYLYSALILPIISFLYLYPFYIAMPKELFIKTIAYVIGAVSLCYFVLLVIGVGCIGYNMTMIRCSVMSSSCDLLPKPREVCDFIRTNESILGNMFGYYIYISVFFVALISTLITSINKKQIYLKSRLISFKIISLVVLTLIIIFFPKIYNLITNINLFKT